MSNPTPLGYPPREIRENFMHANVSCYTGFVFQPPWRIHEVVLFLYSLPQELRPPYFDILMRDTLICFKGGGGIIEGSDYRLQPKRVPCTHSNEGHINKFKGGGGDRGV